MNMVIVQLSGGLGNQMFEYALYLALAARGRQVKMDDVTCYGQGTRPKALDVFGIDYERADREELIQMTDASMAIFHRIRRKLAGRRSKAYREAGVNFDPTVFERDPALLEGCFQSEKYFALCREQVREAFRFRGIENGKYPLPESFRRFLSQIEGTQSVGVHVRRGDYLDPVHGGIYTGICTVDYYHRAFAYIRERVPEAVFYLFSNDPEWTGAHLSGKDTRLVTGSTEDTGYLDLFLMSRCRHQIIANSSFSWWGAWLNENPDKLVAAPERWLNGQDCEDIYTEDMIRI